VDPEPDIETKFVERGIDIPHKLAGHGTKRAYHMAALEAYAEMSSKKDNGRLVLILVDEPELHQHPQRLRHILQTYKRLSGDPSFQIIYSTHSPDLVDLESPEGIYKISRGDDQTIKAKSGSELDEKMARWCTSQNLAKGIFSDGVILVEGWRDEVVLNAMLSVVDLGDKSALKRLMESNVHVIRADGAPHMPDFVRFFRDLEVPLFAIWDADKKSSADAPNSDIIASLGAELQFEASPDSLALNTAPGCLCFANDAGMYLREHLGFEGTPDTDEQKKLVKEMIVDTPDLVPHFDTPSFRGSAFATSTVP